MEEKTGKKEKRMMKIVATNVVASRLTGTSTACANFISMLHCTAGFQNEQLEKSEFSPKLPSCVTFFRPGVTDDCTNQFLEIF